MWVFRMKMDLTWSCLTFPRQMKFNLRKRGFIGIVKEDDFYEGDSNT